MGVKHLWKFVSGLPTASEEQVLHWSAFQGQVFAVDSSIWMAAAESVAQKWTVSDSRSARSPATVTLTQTLRNVLFNVKLYLTAAVRLVFVFDPPSAKPPSAIAAIRALLSATGVAFVILERGDAEAYCSRLCRLKQANAVISTDSDCLVFGADTVIKQKTKHRICAFSLQRILKDSGLKLRRNLVAMALLCGCDSFEGIQGIGAQKAVARMQAAIGHFDDGSSDWIDSIDSWLQLSHAEFSRAIGSALKSAKSKETKSVEQSAKFVSELRAKVQSAEKWRELTQTFLEPKLRVAETSADYKSAAACSSDLFEPRWNPPNVAEILAVFDRFGAESPPNLERHCLRLRLDYQMFFEMNEVRSSAPLCFRPLRVEKQHSRDSRPVFEVLFEYQCESERSGKEVFEVCGELLQKCWPLFGKQSAVCTPKSKKSKSKLKGQRSLLPYLSHPSPGRNSLLQALSADKSKRKRSLSEMQSESQVTLDNDNVLDLCSDSSAD